MIARGAQLVPPLGRDDRADVSDVVRQHPPREGGGRAPFDEGGEILGQQQRRDVDGDLVVGRVELDAVEDAVGDPRVDRVHALRQQLDVLSAGLVGGAVQSGCELDDDGPIIRIARALTAPRPEATTLRNAWRSRRAAQ